jgi:hypothetical protein
LRRERNNVVAGASYVGTAGFEPAVRGPVFEIVSGSSIMTTLLRGAVCLAVVLAAVCSRADDRGRLIFADDFNRTESQETKDEVGNGWMTNSASRAGGNKQVDLKDGAMHIVMHKTADHAVSVRHDGTFPKDGVVELRFKLDDSKDTLGLDFADLDLKTVHAGHLFKVTVGAGKVQIADLKTGNMDLKIYEARKAQGLTDEMKKQLAGKQKSFPVKLNPGEWYTLGVQVAGETVRTTINGKPAGEFSSEGFAHPTKRTLRLAVPREAWVDDVKMFAKDT